MFACNSVPKSRMDSLSHFLCKVPPPCFLLTRPLLPPPSKPSPEDAQTGPSGVSSSSSSSVDFLRKAGVASARSRICFVPCHDEFFFVFCLRALQMFRASLLFYFSHVFDGVCPEGGRGSREEQPGKKGMSMVWKKRKKKC